jgi:hypothetical protein
MKKLNVNQMWEIYGLLDSPEKIESEDQILKPENAKALGLLMLYSLGGKFEKRADVKTLANAVIQSNLLAFIVQFKDYNRAEK